MTRLKSALAAGALVATLAAGLVAVSATGASADVACNRWGECWRVHDRYTNYPPHIGVVFHDDAWWDHHHWHRYHWRADRPDDHGYYRHGEWRPF